MILLALTGLSLAIRVFRIDHHSFWYDEYASFSIAKQSWVTLFGPLMRIETNPPGYYLLQKLWLPFGESRTALRMLPAIAGSLITPVLFVLTRRLVGRPEAWIAAILFTTAPVHLVYAREARGYSILTLAAMIAILAMLTLLRRKDTSPQPEEAAGSTARDRITAIALAGSITTCLFMHNTAVFIPALLGAFVVIDAISTSRRTRRDSHPEQENQWTIRRSRHLLVLILIGAGCLPFIVWIPTILAQATSEAGAPIHWIPPVSSDQIYTTLLSTYPYPKFSKPIVYLTVAIGLVIGWRRSRRLGVLLLVCLIGQPLVALAASLFVPMFIPRILLWPTALVFIPIAIVVTRFGPTVRVSAVILLTALQILAARPEFPRDRILDEWTEAAAVVSASDAAMGGAFSESHRALVCSPRAMALRIQFAARDFPIPSDRWIGVDTRGSPLNPIEPLLPGTGVLWDDFPAALDRYEAAWIIAGDSGDPGTPEADRIAAQFPELRRRGWRIELHSTTSDAVIWRAERRSAISDAKEPAAPLPP